MIYADCHPDRKHKARGKCYSCYVLARYRRRRALGMPSWVAGGRSAKAWVESYQRNKQWRKENPEKANAQYKRRRARRKELYGSSGLRTMASRIKWLEARSAAIAAKSTESTGNGASGVDPSIYCGEGRCRLNRLQLDAGQILRLFTTVARRDARLHARAIKNTAR